LLPLQSYIRKLCGAVALAATTQVSHVSKSSEIHRKKRAKKKEGTITFTPAALHNCTASLTPGRQGSYSKKKTPLRKHEKLHAAIMIIIILQN
jgi:hypothetical protein